MAGSRVDMRCENSLMFSTFDGANPDHVLYKCSSMGIKVTEDSQ